MLGLDLTDCALFKGHGLDSEMFGETANVIKQLYIYAQHFNTFKQQQHNC